MRTLKKGAVMCAAAVAATAVGFGTAAVAQTADGQNVQLRTKDASVSLTGELVEFIGKAYVVDTAMGRLELQASAVDCIGGACPEPSVDPKFGIYGSRTVGTTLIPNLLRGYALAKGATFESRRPMNRQSGW